MAKLIPGKVRSQGSLLYEAGKVSLQEVKENTCIFGWKKKACGTVWTTMSFFVAVLSLQKKNSVRIWQLWKLF